MLTALLVLLLAAIHFFIGKLTSFRDLPRNKWLSLSGGISITYVFLHLIPKLQKYESSVTTKEAEFILLPKESIYLFMLLGFTIFYGLGRMAKSIGDSDENNTSVRGNTFYVHMVAFAVYNFIIGCFMYTQKENIPVLNEILFTTALAFHFMGNDFSLYNQHKERYVKVGRWILGLAVIAGYAVNSQIHLEKAWVILSLSVVAGAIVLNAVKEELPEAGKASFLAFLTGVIAYTILLYMIK